MTDRMNVGIVGLTPGEGWAARAHVPALRAIPGFDIVGVTNSNAESAEHAALEFGIPRAFADVSAMVSDASVDLVVVTVKVPHHREIVEAALAGGKMVYCEWPLGNGLAEVQAIVEREHRAGVRTIVGLQARSAPVIRFVRDLIQEGYVGEVLSSTLVGSGGNWGSTVSARDQYTHDAINGATLLSIPLGHAVDALCYCLGEFRELSVTTTMRRTSYEVSETGVRFPMKTGDQIILGGLLDSGVAVAAHYRGGTSRGTNLRWEINGTDGDLEITGSSGHMQITSLTLRGGRQNERELKTLEVPPKYTVVNASPRLTGGAVNVAEAYAQFIRPATATYAVPSFDTALKRHELLECIEQAAGTGSREILSRDNFNRAPKAV